MRYRHIIWDWNGTLLDDVELCISVMNKLLCENNLEGLNLKRYRELFMFPVIDYYVKLGFKVEDFEEVGAKFIDNYEIRKHECSIFQGAKELLEKSIENGVSHSILSAYKESSLIELVNQYGLAQYFDKMAGHKDIFASGKLEQGRTLMSELGLNSQQTLLVGDTYHDYEVAQALGVDCILMSCGHSSIDNLKRTHKTIVDDFEELQKQIY